MQKLFQSHLGSISTLMSAWDALSKNSSFNPTLVRLAPIRAGYDIARMKRFNPTLVRLAPHFSLG